MLQTYLYIFKLMQHKQMQYIFKELNKYSIPQHQTISHFPYFSFFFSLRHFYDLFVYYFSLKICLGDI